MKLEILKKSLLEAPVVKKGDYFYVVHPITDGVPEIKPELLDEVVHEMQKRIEKCGKIDKIVTMEAMGIPLATALSSRMNIPFVIIRKRSYGLPGEYVVEQKTGYSKSNLYINGLEKGDNIIIVDDVLSTGGTLKAVLSALKKISVIIKGIFIVVDKGDIAKKIMDESKVNIDIIVNIDVVDGNVVIKNI
jgi:adenine phosphoribosyltransferase